MTFSTFRAGGGISTEATKTAPPATVTATHIRMIATLRIYGLALQGNTGDTLADAAGPAAPTPRLLSESRDNTSDLFYIWLIMRDYGNFAAPGAGAGLARR